MYVMAAVETIATIPPGLLSQGGAGVLVAASVWLIYTGRLVPRSTLQKAEERELKWQQAAEEMASQNKQLLENNRIVNDFMRSYPQQRDGAG